MIAESGNSKQWNIFIVLFLLAISALVYAPAVHYDFVSFDDKGYILDNPQVKMGWSLAGIRWAFTTTQYYHWFPLTWLSHMAVTQAAGLNPALHHLVNIILHAANGALLFMVLQQMTGKQWQSVVVATIFAVHPINVESVAWVSERSNVLSLMLGLLCMGSYVRYVRKPGISSYGFVAMFLAFGLMAKPILVTLPFVFLLLDYWPFGRFSRESLARVIGEKIPLLLLVGCSMAITFYNQWSIHVVIPLERFSVSERMGNVLFSYVSYLYKIFWPTKLAVFYPLRFGLPEAQVIAVGSFLFCVSVGAFLVRKRAPYLLVGWLWYIGTLLPMSGLVQAGSHAMADRYAYIPLIGISILVVWGVFDFLVPLRRSSWFLGLLSLGILMALVIQAREQVRVWQNSITLFEHALNVTKKNWVAHFGLGTALSVQGKIQEGEFHYRKALEIVPNNEEIHYSIGTLLAQQGKVEEAIKYFREALRLKPDYSEAHNNLGAALGNEGKTEEAISHFREAVRLNSGDTNARANLFKALPKKELGL